eukprot:gb/GECG01016813.1/.p1 GENE.gb/GECG01016813.1/~~gb/GECG01016813.1/.p1  ORF type:complete len:450 (+),score=61.40 gb/GECG01016813.1/:1-1350(+)
MMSSTEPFGSTRGSQLQTTGGGRQRVRAAGLRRFAAEEGTKECLDFNTNQNIPGSTPRKDSLYRDIKEPGVRVRPMGPMREDPRGEDKVHGSVNMGEEVHTNHLLDQRKKPLDEYMEWRGEQIYHSTKQKPLGKSAPRSEVPKHIKEKHDHGEYKFGQTTDLSAIRAKESIFPENPNLAEDMEKEQKLYPISHKDMPIGVRKNHEFDWSKARIDPNTHRFGKKPKQKSANEIAMVLNPTIDPQQPKSRVVPASSEDCRHYKQAELGHSRYTGAGRPSNYPERFGRPPSELDEWGAGDCIRGDFTAEEQLPDTDLGKSTRPGYRNVAKDPDRRFGVPSVRYDLPQNKGADLRDFSAVDLIAPAAYVDRNVEHEDFLRCKSKEEITDIFNKIGYQLTQEEIDNIWNRAASTTTFTEQGKVSLEEFRRCLNEYLEAQDVGTLPEWWEGPSEN